MGASSEKSRCREAARYYYDLYSHDEAVVPEKIRHHVAGCRVCQARMRRLSESLGTGDAAGPEDRATIETLSLHLDLVNQPVTCADVKPFLPGLEMPAPEIRIPTPVTVHVDHCPPCAADLAALRALALPAEQLARLSRLYSAVEVRDDSACRQAEAGVAALASLSFTAVPAEILDHISLCASCRAEVYRRRQQRETAGLPHASDAEAVACRDLTAARLFDFVVPYGRVPAGDEAEAVAAHVRACPPCREKMQALHRTLYGILERPASEMATVYHTTAGTARGGMEGKSVSHPVSVQVVSRAPAAAARAGEPAAAPGKAPARPPGPLKLSALVKVVCGAAAMILIAMYFTGALTASGTSIGNVLKTLEKAPNVHIAAFQAEDQKPYSEMWVARHLHKFAQKSDRERVLYDLRASRKRIIWGDEERDETVRMEPEECYHVERMMVDLVARVLDDLPKDVKDRDMTAVKDSTDGPPRDVFVFEHTEDRPAYGTSFGQYRHRIVVDAATGLPWRLELYVREAPGEEWRAVTTKVFEYLAERDMDSALKEEFPEP